MENATMRGSGFMWKLHPSCTIARSACGSVYNLKSSNRDKEFSKVQLASEESAAIDLSAGHYGREEQMSCETKKIDFSAFSREAQ